MKKVITILMIFTLLCVCGCGNSSNDQPTSTAPTEKESEQPEVSIVETETNKTASDYFSKQWNDDDYGFFSASYAFGEDGDLEMTYLEYTAPSDDLSNLVYVCTAMNLFVELTDGSTDAVMSAILPGEDQPSLSCMVGMITGTELDGTFSDGVPSWYEEYNKIDEDFAKWIMDCYGEMIDELKRRME